MRRVYLTLLTVTAFVSACAAALFVSRVRGRSAPAPSPGMSAEDEIERRYELHATWARQAMFGSG